MEKCPFLKGQVKKEETLTTTRLYLIKALQLLNLHN